MIMPEYKEYCIRVEIWNIKVLRDFQMLDFPLQKQNGAFKPSPPGSYDDTVLEAKRRNRLAGSIENIEKASRGWKQVKPVLKVRFFVQVRCYTVTKQPYMADAGAKI